MCVIAGDKDRQPLGVVIALSHEDDVKEVCGSKKVEVIFSRQIDYVYAGDADHGDVQPYLVVIKEIKDLSYQENQSKEYAQSINEIVEARLQDPVDATYRERLVCGDSYAKGRGVIKENLKIQIKKMNLEDISDATKMFQRDRSKKSLVHERKKTARDKIQLIERK